jgi:hypothetical protein
MRCLYIKRGRKGCIRRQRHAKRRPLEPVRSLRGAASVLSTALVTSLFGIAASSAAAATCASLAGLALPDTTITAAQSVMALIAPATVTPKAPATALSTIGDLPQHRRGADP